MRIEALPGGGVRVLAPAKVNLHLEVLGLRADGFHQVDTLMQTVSLFDEIEFRPRASGGLALDIRGPGGELPPLKPSPDNSILKAGRLLARRLGLPEPPVDIRLLKRIPIGAGLGGGSSDAAATLVGLTVLLGARLSRLELCELAVEVGSDVAFFLFGGLARCRGRGEIVTPLEPPPGRRPLHLVLAYPGIEVSTALIYKGLDRLQGGRAGLTRQGPLDTMAPGLVWQALETGELFFNRLEAVALGHFPDLRPILEEMRREPFLAVLMTGSGSTIYGVTRTREGAKDCASRVASRVRARVFVVESEPEFRFEQLGDPRTTPGRPPAASG